MDKLITEHEKELGSDNPALNKLIQEVRGKPFWFWINKREHEEARRQRVNQYGTVVREKDHCCFNHIISLPVKNNISYPLFDYEGLVIRALMEPYYLNTHLPTEEERSLFHKKIVDAEFKTADKHDNVRKAHEQVLRERREILVDTKKFRHCAVLKATGLGISELALRWILWMCLRNEELYNSQVVIFTGPNILLSIQLMNRLKNLLKPHGVTFDDKETVLNLPGNIHIECYPSFHADSARGLPNPSIIFVDEFSFFPDHEIDNIFDILNRNVVKSNSYLLAVSTPNKINDAMDRLLKEDISKSIWKRVYLDYTYGLGKIFTQEEIDKVKGNRSFEREFCLKVGGTEGNVFSHLSIQNAQKVPYDPDSVIPGAAISVGIDPAFGGGSKAGITVTRWVDGRVQVVESDEYEQPSFQFLIQKVFEIKRKHGYISSIFIDSAAPVIWAELKRQLSEITDTKYVFDKLAECKKNNMKPHQVMRVIPVAFSMYHAQMLQKVKLLLDEGYLLIHPRFQKLIISLQSATAREYHLDKTGKTTQYHDILDSLRLSTQLYDLAK